MDAVPVVQSYQGYDMILLTGGEPLLKPHVVYDTVMEIRKQTDAPIICYTAISEKRLVENILKIVDGITLTLHEQEDVRGFWMLCSLLSKYDVANKSMRLNIFKGIRIDYELPPYWNVKRDMVWIKDCPLPECEVLMRLPKELI
jgi:hypothetical protein